MTPLYLFVGCFLAAALLTWLHAPCVALGVPLGVWAGWLLGRAWKEGEVKG